MPTRKRKPASLRTSNLPNNRRPRRRLESSAPIVYKLKHKEAIFLKVKAYTLWDMIEDSDKDNLRSYRFISVPPGIEAVAIIFIFKKWRIVSSDPEIPFLQTRPVTQNGYLIAPTDSTK